MFGNPGQAEGHVKNVQSDAREMGWSEVVSFLARPKLIMRLGMVDDQGRPLVHPVWFVYEGRAFWLTVERTSLKAFILKQHSSVYFTVDVEEDEHTKGVRGRGKAELLENRALTTSITRKHLIKYHGADSDEYAVKFLSGCEGCVTVKITPEWLGGWDWSLDL